MIDRSLAHEALQRETLVKRVLLLLGLLAVPALVGGIIWRQRTQALPRRLEQARLLLGTRMGKQLLEEVVRQHPESAEAHLLLAQQLRREEQPGEAGLHLERAAVLGAAMEAVERERLFCTAQVGFPAVANRLEALLDRAPEDGEVLCCLAQGYGRAGADERAEILVSRALAQAPGDARALCLRGRIRLKRRQLDGARVDLEQALQAGPDSVEYPAAQLLLANCLLDMGAFEEARSLFRRCCSQEQDNPMALFGLGRTAVYLDALDEAEQVLTAVLRLRPEHPETLLELAGVHERRGELPQALALLERAEKQIPDRPVVQFRLARILRALNQPERAAVCERRYTEYQMRHSRRTGADERDRPTPDRNPLER
jgi:tetratricopeptide (TPR) repeat protein